jgi:hypothetical protein
MGCKIIPNYFYRKIGGYLKYRNRPHRFITMYSWVLTSQRAVLFLKSIYKYLKLKKSEADLFIKFQNTIKYRGNRYFSDLRPKIIKKRLKFISVMKLLKRKDKR